MNHVNVQKEKTIYITVKDVMHVVSDGGYSRTSTQIMKNEDYVDNVL